MQTVVVAQVNRSQHMLVSFSLPALESSVSKSIKRVKESKLRDSSWRKEIQKASKRRKNEEEDVHEGPFLCMQKSSVTGGLESRVHTKERFVKVWR